MALAEKLLQTKGQQNESWLSFTFVLLYFCRVYNFLRAINFHWSRDV